jgi:hypothetical protein
MCNATTAESQNARLPKNQETGGARMMWRVVKLMLLLAVLGFLGLVGYAYFGDLSPEQREVTQPVTLDAP